MDHETDFYNPEEEYEQIYADELEVLREMEQDEPVPSRGSSKKSLNFDSQPSKPNEVKPGIDRHKTDDNVFPREEVFLLPPMDLDLSCELRTNEGRITFSPEPTTSSHKRTVHDLFGDIDDIDFETESSNRLSSTSSKRFRLGDSFLPEEIIDKDYLTITRILEKRREIQMPLNPLGVSYSGFPETSRSEITLTRRVPKYAFVTLRNGKGEKLYAKLHSDEALSNKILSVSEACKTIRLLSVPFENILTEANSILDKKFEEIESTSTNERVSSLLKSDVSELWVQKYKPVSYLDLLSDEGTNKTLLRWIKLWDKVVFGKDVKISAKSRSSHDESTFKKHNYLELHEELDESGLPKSKIVLLCGPPGLGKTTLAHLIAQHAGYNPVEMNASDDRSPEIFKQQLEAATQMKAVIGKNPKPNCLIIDEIDGAPAPSIDVLIKFARGELKTKVKKKMVKSVGKLKRPIICICNDVYVPALRSLRQMAFVIHFPPTSLSRLASRLVEIARFEHIVTDSGAMMALCEKANNDIRTCLSTMYCLKDEPIRLSTVHKVNIGNKDMQKGLFSVWQEVFQISYQRDKKNAEDAELKKKCKSETDFMMIKRMQSILKSAQGNGDYDRLAQGVYENYLNIKISDSSMKNVSKGLSWFCFVDKLRTHILKSQVYTVMSYLPYAFVMWGYLFSNYQRSKINYPSMMYELNTKQTKYHETIQEVLKGMEPKIRAYCHNEQLLLDTLPFFLYILNPELRQGNIQLFTNAEKQAFRQLVDTMIDYNLNFVQERTLTGGYEFNIDPNIDEVVEFPEIPKTKHLTYSLKMVISREIEQEKLRRLEQSLNKGRTNDDKRSSTLQNGEFANSIDESTFNDVPMEIEPVKSQTQNHLQKLTPKMIKKSPTCTVSRDFFGRIIENPKEATFAVDYASDDLPPLASGCYFNVPVASFEPNSGYLLPECNESVNTRFRGEALAIEHPLVDISEDGNSPNDRAAVEVVKVEDDDCMETGSDDEYIVLDEEWYSLSESGDEVVAADVVATAATQPASEPGTSRDAVAAAPDSPIARPATGVELPAIVYSGYASFLQIKRTRSSIERVKLYVREGFRIMVILRGCAGSGKSHLASRLLEECGIANNAGQHIHSTDHYFHLNQRREYIFDAGRRTKAHHWNQVNVLQVAREGLTPIVVDNANVQLREMEAYVKIAVCAGYEIEVVEPDTPWAFHLPELLRRNRHHVKRQTLAASLERYKHNISALSLLRSFRLEYARYNRPPQLGVRRLTNPLLVAVFRHVYNCVSFVPGPETEAKPAGRQRKRTSAKHRAGKTKRRRRKRERHLNSRQEGRRRRVRNKRRVNAE